MARSRYGISISNGLIDDVQEPSESFDVVWMDNSLEHTFDPLGTMLTAFRLLRKGGAFLIFVPNGQGMSTKYLDQHMYWGHWFLYTPLTLSRMLARVGFRVQKVHASQSAAGAGMLGHTTSVGLVDPKVKEGIDVEGIMPAFNVVAGGPRIEPVLTRTPCYSDFFTILAVKPEDAPEVSPLDSELRAIADQSLLHRTAVTISKTPASPGPDLAAPHNLIASLEGRIIRQPDGDAVYVVENGIRRRVLSETWVAAEGFRLPDDATLVQPNIFAMMPEGPEIRE
jgi:hypothetical protein